MSRVSFLLRCIGEEERAVEEGLVLVYDRHGRRARNPHIFVRLLVLELLCLCYDGAAELIRSQQYNAPLYLPFSSNHLVFKEVVRCFTMDDSPPNRLLIALLAVFHSKCRFVF